MVEACKEYCMNSTAVADLKEDMRDVKGRLGAMEQVSAARTVAYEEMSKELKRISAQNWAIIAMFLATLLGIWLKK